MTDSTTGTLMTREEAERWEKTITIARRYGLSDALAQRLRQYKFRSDVQRERVEAATRLIEAEHRFMEAYEGHQLAYQRLLTVHDEARDREAMRRLENESRLLELQLRRDRLRQALHEQTQDAGGVTGSDFRDEVEKVAQKARLDAAKRAAQAKAKIEARRDLVRERDAIKAEMLREAGGIRTAELERELQNIDDAYQEILDGL